MGILNLRISLHRSNTDDFFFIEMVYRQIPEELFATEDMITRLADFVCFLYSKGAMQVFAFC